MYAYIHPGNDHRPRERCVGYGIDQPDGALCVPCTTCNAPVGEPCTRRGGGTHTRRVDRARRLLDGKAYPLFLLLEDEALRRNPNGPLWSFQGLPHQCGVLGAHVLTDCIPKDVA